MEHWQFGQHCCYNKRQRIDLKENEVKQLEQNVIKISAFRAPFLKSENMVIRLIVQCKKL